MYLCNSVVGWCRSIIRTGHNTCVLMQPMIFNLPHRLCLDDTPVSNSGVPETSLKFTSHLSESTCQNLGQD